MAAPTPALFKIDWEDRMKQMREGRASGGKTTQTTSIMRPLIDYNAKLPSPSLSRSPLMMINSKLKWTRFDEPPPPPPPPLLLLRKPSALAPTECLHATSGGVTRTLEPVFSTITDLCQNIDSSHMHMTPARPHFSRAHARKHGDCRNDSTNVQRGRAPSRTGVCCYSISISATWHRKPSALAPMECLHTQPRARIFYH